jgi:hypothetical protein
MRWNACERDALHGSSVPSLQRWCALAALLVLPLLPASTGFTGETSGEDAIMTTAISAAQIERLARAHAETAVPRADVLRYTPPLPEIWPPSDAARVVVYAYASRPAPTGRIAYAVTSPRVAVLIEMAADRLHVRSTRLMTAESLDQLQPRVHSHVDADTRRTGIDALLAALRAGQLTAEAAQAIRLSYRAWQRENNVIAEVVAIHHHAFFVWLLEDPQ